jgi:hypothetical protein
LEKILIISSPGGKETAQKLFQTLKKNGYSVLNGASKLGQNGLPDLVVAVMTEDSETSPAMMDILHGCSEKGITVVPFVTFRMENKTVSQNFFLDEHDWIDGVFFGEGQETVLDMLKRNYAYLSKRTGKKQRQMPAQEVRTSKKNDARPAQPSGKEQLFKNIIYMCAAVIVVLLFILINGGLKQSNREADNYRANSAVSAPSGNSQIGGGDRNFKIQLSQQLKNSEQNFVGRWKAVEYSDNQFRRTRQDSLDLQGLVNTLLTKAELVFKSDKTFQRIGFSENPETGVWEYDPQSKYLKLQPTGVNQYDVVQIQEITDSRLIIVVQEKLENNDIFTKLTFQKQR